jgi:hypothetical protein
MMSGARFAKSPKIRAILRGLGETTACRVWREETDACFIVRGVNGQALAYVYCEERPIPHGGTFTLTTWFGKMLSEAEELYGRRDMDWTLIGVEGAESASGRRSSTSLLRSEERREHQGAAAFPDGDRYRPTGQQAFVFAG